MQRGPFQSDYVAEADDWISSMEVCVLSILLILSENVSWALFVFFGEGGVEKIVMACKAVFVWKKNHYS